MISGDKAAWIPGKALETTLLEVCGGAVTASEIRETIITWKRNQNQQAYADMLFQSLPLYHSIRQSHFHTFVKGSTRPPGEMNRLLLSGDPIHWLCLSCLLMGLFECSCCGSSFGLKDQWNRGCCLLVGLTEASTQDRWSFLSGHHYNRKCQNYGLTATHSPLEGRPPSV